MAWGPGETRLAVVEDGRPAEFSVARAGTVAGAVFLGRVVEVAPRIDAAFVEIGLARPGFLPGGQGLTQGSAVLVQARADGHGAKGALLTADISFAGRFLALSPLRPGFSLSRRLDAADRERLREAAAALVAEGEGVVVRTAAARASAGDLAAELAALRADWGAVDSARAGARAPALLWRPDPLARLLADHPDVVRVMVDDAAAFAAARARFGALVERGATFDDDVEEAFAAALAPVAPLPGGGRLVIERTQALTAIDVDSGPSRPADANAQAVAEIARQLRLRSIGGQIVVDFVSGGGKGSLARLAEELRRAVADDPVPTHVFGVSPLGLVEMTRERRGPALAELMLESGTRASAAAAARAALRAAVAEEIGRAHV